MQQAISSLTEAYDIKVIDPTVIRILADRGFDLSLPDDRTNFSTPLLRMVEFKQDECIAELLRCGADPNVTSPKSRSRTLLPLHLAATQNSPSRVRLLLEGGADPLLRDAQGEMALAMTTCQTCCDLLVAASSPEKLVRFVSSISTIHLTCTI